MDANVLKALNDANNDGYRRPSLNNIIIYGRVRCLIDRPSFLGEGVKSTNGYFALLDAYALKCLGEDYFICRANIRHPARSVLPFSVCGIDSVIKICLGR